MLRRNMIAPFWKLRLLAFSRRLLRLKTRCGDDGFKVVFASPEQDSGSGPRMALQVSALRVKTRTGKWARDVCYHERHSQTSSLSQEVRLRRAFRQA